MVIIGAIVTDSQRNQLCRLVRGIDWRPMALPVRVRLSVPREEKRSQAMPGGVFQPKRSPA